MAIDYLDQLRVSTENATVMFGLLAGVAGGASQIIAGSKLSTIDAETIAARDLVVPVLVAGLSTVLGALLLPGSIV